jgi:hypothetical protein
MSIIRRLDEDFLAVLFICALCILFFFDVLFGPAVFFAGDNMTINLPSKVQFFRTLAQGNLPLWNPYTFSGTPFLADINLGLLSPFNLFYAFFEPFKALSYSIVSAVLFSGISMYWYGRTMKLTRWGSVTASVVFMFSGSVMTHTMNTAILNTVVWLPLLMICLEKLADTKRVRYTLYSSMILSLMLFGGHIQYFYYALLFTFAYIVSKPQSLTDKVLQVFYVIVPSFFLSAVQLLPFLEYTQVATRPAKDLAYAAGGAPLVSFIHLILPNFFGVMKDGTSWGATSDINGYLGIIPPILAVCAVWTKRTRRRLFFAFAALVSLLLALGRYSPLYLAAFHFMPFFARFRSPASILIVYSFCVAVLSGYGIDGLFRYLKQKGGNSARIIAAFCAGLIGLAGSLFFKTNARDIVLPAMEALNRIRTSAFVSRFLSYAPERKQIIFGLWSDNLSVLFSVLALFLAVLYFAKKRACLNALQKSVFVLLVATDMLLFAGNTYITADVRTLKFPDALATILRKDTSTYRIISYQDPGAKPPFADSSYFPVEAVKALDLLQPNMNVLMGEEGISGYASIVNASYSAYLKSRTADPTGISLPHPDAPEIDELGVKYAITGGTYAKELEQSEGFRKLAEFKDERINRSFAVYENMENYPRAFVLDAGSIRTGKASVRHRGPNGFSVSVDSPVPGTLVVTNLPYPGWHAYRDNKRIAIGSYKAFQSVPIPAGRFEYFFRYEPRSFWAGAIISIVNWLYMSGFLVFAFLKEQKKIREEFHVRKTQIKNDA